MSDIFISYSSKDRPWVEQFAKTLGTYGWSVWWDRSIPTGGSFNAVIRHELRAAKCAIVVWSEQSVDSEWVQAEADEAKKQDKYLPVRIDASEIPLGFTQRTFQFLADWEAGTDHPGFSQLLKDIERLVKSPPQSIETGSRPWRARIHPLWLLSLPTVATAMIVIGLMMWSIPARVQVELTSKRIEFVVNTPPSQAQPMLGPFDARSVAIDKFTTISFEPEIVEIADPSQYQMDKDDFPASAWKSLRLASVPITLAAKDSTRNPRITVEGPNRNGLPTIRLDPIALASGAQVTLETRGEKTSGLTIKIAGQKNFTLPVREPIKLTAQHTEMRGLAESPFQNNDELTYRIQLRERASWIEIASSSDGPVLSPTFVSEQSGISVIGGIPVASLEFTRQDPSGDQVSALTGKGTITFPDYPHLGSVSISEHDAIGLKGLERFTIEQVTLMPGANGMNLVGTGMIDQIRTKTGQIPVEYNLSAFDALKHNPQLLALFAIIVWVFPTTMGAYRLYKEFKR